MWKVAKKVAVLVAIGGALGIGSSTNAQMPVDRPFSMRGVELGITIDEFREAAIPNDDSRYSGLISACSNGTEKLAERFYLSAEDTQLEVVECQWFSYLNSIATKYVTEHWVNIGKGGGWPRFRFIESEGDLRLFQIKFYANNQYHPDILDALTRGYGAAAEGVSPVKTQAGAEFTSLTSLWDNGLSSITLVERCGHLKRYCLTYEHTGLATIYQDRREALASKAAKKI